MISRQFTYLRWLPLYMHWFWAYSGFSKNLPDIVRVKRLEKINAPNGPRQIIMTQIASALWRLEQKDQAIAMFKRARESELGWGKRRNESVSEYIVLYCEYCSKLISFGASNQPDEGLMKDFQKLKTLPVPDSIIGYKMTLPTPPGGALV